MGAVVMMTVALEWDRLSGPAWVGMDTATAFFPWYAFLGEHLRAGQIPTWNPHTFSGAPFAADPESGWMYLPAMVAFTLFNLDTAVRVSLVFHSLLAGISTYALARVLGANAFGALVAATLYAHSGFLEGHNVCCYAYADVAAWLPTCVLGAELALQSRMWLTRVLWCGLSGLAFSQILAAWIGQGAYYAALVLAGCIACRASATGLRRTALVAFGIGVTAIGLGAAGVLPRLEYNFVSNLPGGYPEADVSLRATSWNDWGVIAGVDRLLLQPGFEYIGWPALILGLAALPLLARPRWRRLMYFAGLGVVVLVLARAEPTPLHALFSLLPGFERIHARSPERALIVFYLAPALLAAATVTWLSARRHGWLAGLVALVIVSVDLHVAWQAQADLSLAGGGDYQFARVDLARYVAPSGGAEFLTREAKTRPPFRYFGYAGHVFGGPMPYTLRWNDPDVSALQVNNRAVLTGLDDIQGYNPIHVARYDDLVAELNGESQNYHHADVFESGFNSPVLDLLNVRFVVLPTTLASDEVAPHFTRDLQQVYADDGVRILENPAALPRAWLVHAATSGVGLSQVNPREVAILEGEGTLAPVSPASGPEAVDVARVADDRLELHVKASAEALLIASEVAYPAWHAYLDGQAVPMYVADVALRGVAVPPGEHQVEMRYESSALQVGLILTTLTALALAGVAILQFAVTFKTKSRDGSGEVRCKTGAVPQL